MEAIFMNRKKQNKKKSKKQTKKTKQKTNDSYKFVLNLKNSNKHAPLQNLLK